MKPLICYITILALIALAMCVLIARKEIAVRDRHIGNIQKNCIVVRKTSIIKDLQRFYNSLNSPRYECGEEDGDPGSKFRRAAVNYSNDQYAEPYFEAVMYQGAAK